MAKQIILPSHIIGHFLPKTPCGACGRTGQSFEVHYPRILCQYSNVEITYPVRCSCGKPTLVCIHWPILLFGYVLARLQVVEIHRKWTRSRASMAVSADCSAALEEMIRDYGKVVGPINASLTEPNETDRIAFELNEAEWAQFLHRLGLD